MLLKQAIKRKLEDIRKAILEENISYYELAQLQDLKDHISKDDILLREWAGIEEGK